MSGPEQEAGISSVFVEGIAGLAKLTKLGEVVREGGAETVGDADGRCALEDPDDTDGTDDGDADNVGYAEAVGPGVARHIPSNSIAVPTTAKSLSRRRWTLLLLLSLLLLAVVLP